jgi:quercetin dioxygenase-like cupin family protein
MAIPHAKSGEVMDVRPLGPALTNSQTTTLAKTDSLEIIRLVIPQGKDIAEHRVAGEITIQCLEGHVIFNFGAQRRDLLAGQLLFLEGDQPHSLHAVEHSSVLVTILL